LGQQRRAAGEQEPVAGPQREEQPGDFDLERRQPGRHLVRRVAGRDVHYSAAASRAASMAGCHATRTSRGRTSSSHRSTSDRPTRDLDFFTAPGRGDLPAAVVAFEAAARDRGWRIETLQSGAMFVRLLIGRRDEQLLVDLAVDALSAPST
jgi:hypothetical protein